MKYHYALDHWATDRDNAIAKGFDVVAVNDCDGVCVVLLFPSAGFADCANMC